MNLLSQPSWAAWIEIPFLPPHRRAGAMSQPSWAAWIEIRTLLKFLHRYVCRSPLGLRGLKSPEYRQGRQCPASQPSWAAWIEIVPGGNIAITVSSRSPLGLRGLKSEVQQALKSDWGRSPLGLRGLKYLHQPVILLK